MYAYADWQKLSPAELHELLLCPIVVYIVGMPIDQDARFDEPTCMRYIRTPGGKIEVIGNLTLSISYLIILNMFSDLLLWRRARSLFL